MQRLTVYTAGVTEGYAQFTNGSTGASAGNGLLVGVSAAGDAIINHQNANALVISTFNSERLRIDASGNQINTPSNTPPTLTVNGQFNITPTTNTNARISYRGSDGVTRTADITLA